MKKSFPTLRNITIVLVVLLCAVAGLVSFMKLNSPLKEKDFDLYCLIPSSAVAILDTDNTVQLVREIDGLSCSRNNHFLYASHLFADLKSQFHNLLNETPHGLSEEMNRMLISFHEPDNPMNQVFYCALGRGDKELVEQFISKNRSESYNVRHFDYNGMDIRIYPTAGGEFICCCITDDFLIVSYQKRLLEQALDAYLGGESILEDPGFLNTYNAGKVNIPATLYVRMLPMRIGKINDNIPSYSYLGGWTEFGIKMNGDAIYFSGTNHAGDSCFTLMNALRAQEPVTGFPGDILPHSTFFFTRWATSDPRAILHYTGDHAYSTADYSDRISEADDLLLEFLEKYCGDYLTTCIFTSIIDTIDTPCAIMHVPVSDRNSAESVLSDGKLSRSLRNDYNVLTVNESYTEGNKPHKIISLSHNSLFTQFTGIINNDSPVYACFYDHAILLAPDTRSLKSYIYAMENNLILHGNPVYEEGIGSLSSNYSFMMMGDIQSIDQQPGSFARLIPGYFFRHKEFFNRFTFTAQFTCTEDGTVYPNLVFLYNGSH